MTLDATVARVGELSGLLTSAAARTTGLTSTVTSAPSAGPSPTAAPFAAQLAASMSGLAPAASVASSAASSASPVMLAATPSAVSGSAPATPYAAEISAAAARNGVDPNLLSGLIRAESNFDPRATSPAGAQGLTQLMPATAASVGVSNPLDPAQSIEGGARYLRAQLDRFGGDPVKALAAYNAGPGAVERFGGVPPYAETQGYVRRVLGYAQGALA